MKPFMDNDFLLSTPTAQKLYHEYAADMPIIDYHCHVSPREIFEDAGLRTSPRCGWAATITNGV